MEREVIADVGIWTAKKRYMLNVHDSEAFVTTLPNSRSWESKRLDLRHRRLPEVMKETIALILTGTE